MSSADKSLDDIIKEHKQVLLSPFLLGFLVLFVLFSSQRRPCSKRAALAPAVVLAGVSAPVVVVLRVVVLLAPALRVARVPLPRLRRPLAWYDLPHP